VGTDHHAIIFQFTDPTNKHFFKPFIIMKLIGLEVMGAILSCFANFLIAKTIWNESGKNYTFISYILISGSTCWLLYSVFDKNVFLAITCVTNISVHCISIFKSRIKTICGYNETNKIKLTDSETSRLPQFPPLGEPT